LIKLIISSGLSVDLKSISSEETEMKHHALYDCYVQLKAMDIALKKLI
jgi:hypothetical protein